MPTREISSRDVFLPHAVNYGKSIDTQTIIFAWHLVAYFLLVSHEGQAMTFFSETKKKEILSTSCELQGGSCLFPTSTKLPFTSANRSANNFFFKKGGFRGTTPVALAVGLDSCLIYSFQFLRILQSQTPDY